MKAASVDLEGFTETPVTWPAFADFAGNVATRWEHMNGVMDEVLARYRQPKILDLAAGGGHDTILLAQRGYDVTPNEFDPELTGQLQTNLQAAGQDRSVLGIDWLDFLTSPALPTESYDVVFSLGNSFPTYLFKEADRQRALQGFWRILKPGGTLFFDTRNYDYMLEHAEEILQDPKYNYRYSYQNTFMNRDIEGFPEEIEPEKVRIRYKHLANKTTAYLDLWPATIERMQQSIQGALGDVATTMYYDYQTDKPEHFDFVQYVLRKPA